MSLVQNDRFAPGGPVDLFNYSGTVSQACYLRDTLSRVLSFLGRVLPLRTFWIIPKLLGVTPSEAKQKIAWESLEQAHKIFS